MAHLLVDFPWFPMIYRSNWFKMLILRMWNDRYLVHSWHFWWVHVVPMASESCFFWTILAQGSLTWAFCIPTCPTQGKSRLAITRDFSALCCLAYLACTIWAGNAVEIAIETESFGLVDSLQDCMHPRIHRISQGDFQERSWTHAMHAAQTTQAKHKQANKHNNQQNPTNNKRKYKGDTCIDT